MGRSEKKKRQDARVKAAVQAALAKIDAKKAATGAPPGVIPKTGKIVQQQASPVQQQQPLPPIKGVSKAVLAKVGKFKVFDAQVHNARKNRREIREPGASRTNISSSVVQWYSDSEVPPSVVHLSVAPTTTRVASFLIVQIQNQQMAAANVVPKTKRVDAVLPNLAPAPKKAPQLQQVQIAAAAAVAAAAAITAINETPPVPQPQQVKKIAAIDDGGMDSAQEVETGGEEDDKQKASGKQAATA
uniref:Uncharacterized protein n=1 Tax=Romanomermis culicivorax TaxID=13658 RepID=A0A915JHZ5_ROMCU